MDAEGDKKLMHIKDQVEQGEYRVDPRSVADAILRRIRGATGATLGAGLSPHRQNECSYPDRPSAPGPANTTSLGPSRTRPIQVSWAALAASSRLAAGTHTHSS